MSAPTTPVETAPGRLRVIEVMSSAWIAAAVSALAELGVADLMDEPKTVGHLAEHTGSVPAALARFLRAAAAAGLFTEPEPGTFALTEAGQYLRSDVPGSMRAMCQLTGREEFARTWAHAVHTVRTGEPAFAEAVGEPPWAYMGRPENSELSALFHGAMSASAGEEVVLDYDFTGVGHVVDVGGGRGAMVAALLGRHPGLRATLFDLPNAVAGASDLLSAAGVADRVDVRAGSFFDPLPPGGDVYLLSRVIGNWNDESAVEVLRGVRAAMHDQSRLVIVAHVPGPQDRTHYPRALDLYMFVLVQAALRTEEEYVALLARAGLELSGSVYHPDGQSLLEARPV